MQSTLTHHTPGSFREIWALSWPLMLAYLSLGVMLFTDRWYLAQLDCETLNASVTGGMFYWVIAVIPMAIAGVSEVVVGRYNGSCNKKMIGATFWACIALFLLITPLAVLLSGALGFTPINPAAPLENAYYGPLMLFLPFQLLTNALTGLFIGVGRVRIIVITTLLGAIVNIGFDNWLIFGGFGVKPLGIAGAAIGTGLAQMAQALFMISVALNKQMRSLYTTHQLRAHLRVTKGIIKEFFSLGLPLGIGQSIEIIGHLFFLKLTQKMGTDQFTLTALAQSLYMLLIFVGISINKTAATVCANAVGSRQPAIISLAIKNCILLIAGFSLIIFVGSTWGYKQILEHFLNPEDFAHFAACPDLLDSARWTLIGFNFFFFFDNIHWAINGVLVAKADTRIIMWVNICAYWGVVVLPLALLVHWNYHQSYLGWFLLALSTCLASIFYLDRHQRRPANLDYFTG